MNQSQYDLSTVQNKEAFQDAVELKDCPVVGRSLVAKRPLCVGETVLAERPLLKYHLDPVCRSSTSPFHSKALWRTLVSLVRKEEGLDDPAQQENVSPDQRHQRHQQDNHSDDSDYNDDYSDDESEESDDEDKEDEEPASAFCPGVPAAMVAYLRVHPPPTSCVRNNPYKPSNFEFFYYPTFDHPTVRLIHNVARQAIASIKEFAHLQVEELASFVLKIYSNAHTVAYRNERGLPTHSRKKERRRRYESKWGDALNANYGGWADTEESSVRPSIALMLWGSKFAHSCSPNLFLQYEPANDAMVFTVVRPLNPGDVLTFSYLPEDDRSSGGLVCGTTVMRQEKLQQFKFFDCACERCSDWDVSRGAVCPACGENTLYLRKQWTCQSCGVSPTAAPEFIGERESYVQKMVMAFAARIQGTQPVGESMMRMLEPFLEDLLHPSDSEKPAVPKTHWTYGFSHSLLANYHLALFPGTFGRGLADRLGMTNKGLQETKTYIEFLHHSIWRPQSTNDNPVAAFFAAWRILSIVIDVIIQSTQKLRFHREKSIDHPKEDEAKEESNEPLYDLVPMEEEWQPLVYSIMDIVHRQWIPVIQTIFQNRESAVMTDILQRIDACKKRLDALEAIAVQ
ncbi:uncharacterized protein BYT42DRAFT_501417 [Radiomyces spectabilis]|uniref:uncharacterized protein n=1 Tax=Radiomyces spectabilis TaxID=64574 RepID=UPI002220BC6F|nr:uncharacterized protein BYT42DRAFT_501417 [Radiomyces spectabilis]KAI8371398.1 hypothetical protein BYT42DRAFT_501417 [Radiomyces spectabilis]